LILVIFIGAFLSKHEGDDDIDIDDKLHYIQVIAIKRRVLILLFDSLIKSKLIHISHTEKFAWERSPQRGPGPRNRALDGVSG